MRNFTLGLFFILLSGLAFGQYISPEMEFAQEKLTQREEFYFTFNCENRDLVREISRQLSIDKVQGSTVFAYANPQEFAVFLTYNLAFEPVYEYYNSSKALTMATTVAQMASWDKYPTHAVYLQMLDNFVTNYPALCKLETIGTSVDGYVMKCLVISDNVANDEDEPEFWWSGTMHGDETTGFIMELRFADYLLSNYGTNTQVTNLVNNMEIYINPLANPDGTYYGSSGGTTVSGARRANSNNIDLNRNFPTANGDPYTMQPEIQAMMDYASSHDFVMSANTHGGIELMNYPWDTWQSWENMNADDTWWQYVAYVYRDEVALDAPATYFEGPGTMDYGAYNTTGVTHGADWYYAIGSRQDYMNYYQHIKEITIELSDTKLLGTENLNTYWGYNRDAMMLYTEQALYGFRGIVTDACSGSALSDVKVEIVGHDKDGSEVYSSAPIGNYHRPIIAGTWNVTFSKTGYASKTLPVTVINDQSTRLDVELIPDGVATPNFTATPTSIFEGATVDFTNTTSGTVTSQSWAFEEGSPATSTVLSPQDIAYANSGTYDVTLSVVSLGCTVSETKANYITVSEPVPVVTNFSGTPTTLAMGGTVNFTDLSTNNPTSWSWTFSGGTPATSTAQNPSVVYSTPGTYDVILTATNAFGGNTETKVGYITVTESDLLMSNGTSTLCGGLFKDSGGDSNYGDNLIYTHTIYPATPGTYVRLSFSSLNLEPNGGSCYDYITIYDGENTSATEIGTYCGTNYTVIGTSGVVTATNSAGALTIYFSSDANTNALGWVAEISCYVNTNPPTANFTSDVTSTCSGVVQFTDQSSLATSWLWNFGDGNTSTEQNPLHAYLTDGTFTVSLTATNAYGSDVHSVNNMIAVDMPTAPTTTGASACGPATLTLGASGTGTLAWYDAAIGGNQITTGNSYNAAFSNTTTYYVEDYIPAATQNVGPTVNGASRNVAAIEYFDVYEQMTLVSVQAMAGTAGNKTITLLDNLGNTVHTASVNVGTTTTTVTLNWVIEPGTGYQLLTPVNSTLYRINGGITYPYTIPGLVSITGCDIGSTYFYSWFNWSVQGTGCSSARTPVTATINPIPADVTVTGGGTQCGGSMTLNATGGTGGTIYWQNTTNNGTSTTTASSSQTVSSNGTYYFRAQSSAGCWGNQGSATVTINPVPAIVSVSGGGTQCGGSMTLTATGGAGGTVYWQGTTSGGTSTTTASSSQSVSASGTYYFRSQSALGCWGPEGSATVTINPLPTDVIVTGGGTQCGGSMTLNATGGTGGTIYWQNTTNNGTSTASASSSQTVSSNGTYYFRAMSGVGCWGNQGSATVTIYPSFSASATATDESGVGMNDGSVTVNMTGGTAPFDGTWTPSGSTNTAGTSMTLNGLTGGFYSVLVEDANGCTGNAAATVNTIGAAPIAAFDADFTEGCDNLTVEFTDLSSNNPNSWAWDFGDGNNSTEQNPSHTYNAVGVYTVILVATNTSGSDEMTMTNFITVGETPSIIMSMTPEVDDLANGTVTADVTGGQEPYIYEWNVVGNTASLTGLVAGNYCVTVIEDDGCEAYACITVTSEATVIPPVADFAADITEGCGTLSVQFTDLSLNIPNAWIWNFGDGGTSYEQNPLYVYDNPGVYNVSLTVTNDEGGDLKIITGYIVVNSIPELSFSVTHESGIGMNDGSITMTINDGLAPYDILWSNDATEAINDNLASGVYSVTVVDDNGCEAFGNAEVMLLSGVGNSLISEFSIYPNPSSGNFFVKSESEIKEITILDAVGKIYYHKEVNKTEIEIAEDLTPGIYMLKLVFTDAERTLKIVIK